MCPQASQGRDNRRVMAVHFLAKKFAIALFPLRKHEGIIEETVQGRGPLFRGEQGSQTPK